MTDFADDAPLPRDDLHAGGATATISAEDEALLDSALRDSKLLLSSSLRCDQRRRWLRDGAFLVVGAAAALLVSDIVRSWLPERTVTPDQQQRAAVLAEEGWMLWGQGQMASAQSKFAEAVKFDPKAANAWNGLGWALFNQAKHAAAIDAFRECIALQPDHPAALNGLGQASLFSGDFVNAKGYLLAAAPQAPAAWWGLARLYLLQGEYDKALQYARRICEQDPNDQWGCELVAAAKARRISDELWAVISIPGVDVARPASAQADDADRANDQSD